MAEPALQIDKEIDCIDALQCASTPVSYTKTVIARSSAKGGTTKQSVSG